jgi:hypothetical protein
LEIAQTEGPWLAQCGFLEHVTQINPLPKGFWISKTTDLDYLRLASVCCSKLPVKLSASALTGVKHDALKAQRHWDPDHSFFNHSVWSNKNGDVLIH